MGAINLHNRDRFYYNFGTPIYDTHADYNPKQGAWSTPFTGPNPRGPLEVDTINPITIRRNRLETVQHVGEIGVPGEWWGRQNTLFVLDIDDGNGRYVIEENLLLATGGVIGLKLGHIVDDISVRNNIVIARPGPPIPGADPEHGGTGMGSSAFEIGPQCKENTMNASLNIIVNLDGGLLMSSHYGNFPYFGESAEAYLEATPKPQTMDRNVYFSQGGTFGMFPNVTAARELLGLDVHSLLQVDPLLDLSDLSRVHVKAGSPALGLGFRNFEYGPRGS